jgi:hypothetical protein
VGLHLVAHLLVGSFVDCLDLLSAQVVQQALFFWQGTEELVNLLQVA